MYKFKIEAQYDQHHSPDLAGSQVTFDLQKNFPLGLLFFFSDVAFIFFFTAFNP